VKGLLICIVGTAAAAAIFVPAGTASQPGTVIDVDASLTVPYAFNPVADAEVDLTRTRVNLGPHLGSFIISGYTIVVPDCVETDEGGVCTLFSFERQTNLVFTSGNRGKLVLFEDVVWLSTDPVPPTTWAVNSTASTGKYEGYSGSGAYSMDFSVSDQVTISLTGTLTTA
jgi:hypothetical protein